MKKSGNEVSISEVRDWRRSKNSKNYRAVPDFALDVLFNYLFNLKRIILKIVCDFYKSKYKKL